MANPKALVDAQLVLKVNIGTSNEANLVDGIVPLQPKYTSFGSALSLVDAVTQAKIGRILAQPFASLRAGLSGTITGAADNGAGDVRYTTGAAHGLTVGDIVTVAGMGRTDYNVAQTVTAISDATHWESAIEYSFEADEVGTWKTPGANLVDSGKGLKSHLALPIDAFTPTDGLDPLAPSYAAISDATSLDDTTSGLQPHLASASDDQGTSFDDLVAALVATGTLPLSYLFADAFTPVDGLDPLAPGFASISDVSTLDDSIGGLQPSLAQFAEDQGFNLADLVAYLLTTPGFETISASFSDVFTPVDLINALHTHLVGAGEVLSPADYLEAYLGLGAAAGGGYNNIIIGLNQMGNQGPSIGGM
jgi:hypothetical protein